MAIIPFPKKPDQTEPMDPVDVCTITVNGKGEVFVWRHDYIETGEQYNWLIAKVGEGISALISDKAEALANQPDLG
jgi:hypothetical protein